MSRSTAGRALTVAALAAAMVAAGAGSPVGAAPSDRGVTRSATGYADVFLDTSEQAPHSAFVDLTVFAPEDVPAFGRGEVFVSGYDCQPAEVDGEVSSVAGTVDGTTAASADGTLMLICDYHVGPDEVDPGLPSVTATATFDLEWTADGPVDRHVLAGPASTCVSFLEVRPAAVTGSVQIVVPDLDVSVVATPVGDSNALRQEQSICRPARR
jgi:hypothetical protein